ncbi:Nif3-like dinuclear metal center hexameric protein, partial [Campylobacter upsaliensis]|nr:Nif3-like dinuclear metal center hexameric protein [Campylobacter upsaliensis]
MKLSEIYAFLNELSPFEKQASWDNSGLLLGNLDDDISKLYLSLDVDENLIKNAEENSLFITHHPLIFKPLRNLSEMAYPKNLLKEMIKKNIALISLHTNYDLSHLNAYFVKEILGFEKFLQEDFLIYVDVNLSFYEL